MTWITNLKPDDVALQTKLDLMGWAVHQWISQEIGGDMKEHHRQYAITTRAVFNGFHKVLRLKSAKQTLPPPEEYFYTNTVEEIIAAAADPEKYDATWGPE